MPISIIAAMSTNRVIGKSNALPWSLPAELKHLRETTRGHHFIIGRKTFEAIGSKPLPKRTVIVVSSTLQMENSADILIARSLSDALELAKKNGDDEPFIGGGTKIFEEGLEVADKLYLTTVNATLEGDTYFPEMDFKKWKLVSSNHHVRDADNIYSWDLNVYEKVN